MKLTSLVAFILSFIYPLSGGKYSYISSEKFRLLFNIVLFFYLVFAPSKNVCSQSFYDINTIQTIAITFGESNWDYMLDTSKAGKDGFVKALSVTINGEVFHNVGVKYKGNSTYSPANVKNPLHIELDTYTDQNYGGITDIKLSNGAKDPSFIRETLSYSILGNYMDAPSANYAHVYINGTLMGLYVNVESVSKKFVKAHFDSKDNPFFSCSPPSGAQPGIRQRPNLAYLGPDSSLYFSVYEMKSEFGWNDLKDLCFTLTRKLNDIESVLDVDKALWMLAFDNLLVNLDSYIGGLSQNYYLYKDRSSRFNCILWDLNESFGVFKSTGTGDLSSTDTKIGMSHLLHESDYEWPLIYNLLSVPSYRKMYLAHMATLINENFVNGSYLGTAQSLQTIIEASVHSDPNKFFTEDQFRINLTEDVNSTNGSIPGIRRLMQGRYLYLTSLSDFKASRPVIAGSSSSDQNPVLGSSVFITSHVTNASYVAVGFRYNSADKFAKVQMFDDGLHGDAYPGDNIFGVSLDLKTTVLQYYIYAENSASASYSPERAEHEFYALVSTAPPVSPGEIVINEFMAQNNSVVADPAGEYDDWIELFNATGTTLSLDNLCLSDNYLNLSKWSFPSGSVIVPNEYLIVWADEDGGQDGLHASFKLAFTGEDLILSGRDGTIIDEITFGEQYNDMAYARVPDATGSFIVQNPTFKATNGIATITKDDISNINNIQDIICYPNPFNKNSVIKYWLTTNENIKMTITGLDGVIYACLIDAYHERGTYSLNFNPNEHNLQPGIFLCRISNSKTSRYLKMIYIK